ncbi:MAG: manganese catalase family protein [Clostridiales bacterium]|jgi:Mn-containing catalase|nr:manganese catalase family protein [Clostridiales bacterium]
MFKHEKQLLYNVRVEKPNPLYANLLQEQLGGAYGETSAAMQYIAQSMRVKDPDIKDMFLDIGAEELGHMEMVGTLINLFNGHNLNAKEAKSGGIQAHVQSGLNPALVNASGVPWTGAYVAVTGDLCADLLSDIASEQRAKVAYEYIYRQMEDKLARDAIDFLLNREEAHNAMFRAAFNKVSDTGSNKSFGVTEDSKLYFNLSSPDNGRPFDITKDYGAPEFKN